MKTDYSLECEKCGIYNLQDGVIEKGHIYCLDCHNKIEEKRNNWKKIIPRRGGTKKIRRPKGKVYKKHINKLKDLKDSQNQAGAERK